MMKDMLGRGHAISVPDAQRLIQEHLPALNLKQELLPLEEAYGRVLCADITSSEDVPAFSRSSMDGYAVLAADTYGASETSPSYITVVGEVLMGQAPSVMLIRGQAALIPTGGMLPQGADAVLMLEYAQEAGPGMIEAQRSLAEGENVIERGDDVKAGEVLLRQGHRLRPQDVAVMAGIGITHAPVYERPRVSIISTGDEVVPPNARLAPGQVRDMNSFTLSGLIQDAGAIPIKLGIFKDDFALIIDTLRQAASDSHLVLITGGSSVGVRDMTERAMTELGKVLFHRVALKPGKPFLAGIVGQSAVFGIPGHPRAVAVTFETFIRPALVKLSGEQSNFTSNFKGTVIAKLTHSLHASGGRQESINVQLSLDGEILLATPILGSSGMLTTMVRSHGSITIPAGKLGFEAGQNVEVKLH